MHWRLGEAPAKTRLALALLAGLGAWLLCALLPRVPWELRALVAWDALALTFLLSALHVMRRADTALTRAIATSEDDSRAVSAALVVAGSVASLVGVGFALARAGTLEARAPTLAALLTAAGVGTVALSWALVHTVYALRYAHAYFTAPEGGIDFPGTDGHVTYLEFLYLAFTIGMTFQVSDTDVTSRPMRRLLLRHALVSYLFGTVLVALTINAAAGLLR
ncbi:DUF1345 domain-containing protein [Deinococcus maricopensis]|nr:DUF1345 domain-containing protein [Deinococcus maricopensis]